MKLAILFILIILNLLNLGFRGFTFVDYRLHPDLLRLVRYPISILTISSGISLSLLFLLLKEMKKSVYYVEEDILDIEINSIYTINWFKLGVYFLISMIAILLPEIKVA